MKHQIKKLLLSIVYTKKGTVRKLNHINTTIKIVMVLFCSCNVPAHLTKVQDYELNSQNGHWEAIGSPHLKPDTLTTIHGYKWKREHIIAIQDYKMVNGKWAKYGEPYPIPDTLHLIHAFIE